MRSRQGDDNPLSLYVLVKFLVLVNFLFWPWSYGVWIMNCRLGQGREAEESTSCLMKEKVGFEVKTFRAPPWARLLQEEWEVETRRRLDKRI